MFIIEQLSLKPSRETLADLEAAARNRERIYRDGITAARRGNQGLARTFTDRSFIFPTETGYLGKLKAENCIEENRDTILEALKTQSQSEVSRRFGVSPSGLSHAIARWEKQ